MLCEKSPSSVRPCQLISLFTSRECQISQRNWQQWASSFFNKMFKSAESLNLNISRMGSFNKVACEKNEIGAEPSCFEWDEQLFIHKIQSLYPFKMSAKNNLMRLSTAFISILSPEVWTSASTTWYYVISFTAGTLGKKYCIQILATQFKTMKN